MDLRRQPPRRPTNLSIAGIVGFARMIDKARAHNAETIGDYIYGENSGLDNHVLTFLGISADDFATAVKEKDDVDLFRWAIEKSGKTPADIEAFNENVTRELSSTEAHRQRLKQRLERYAPGRTDIKTALQSMELDDWGSFWQVNLTTRPPRSARSKDIGGICGAARMADKARAERAGKIGEYKYGQDSGQDIRILTALGITADDFADAAVNNPNDIELGEWVLEKAGKSPEEIDTLNQNLVNYGANEDTRERFEARCKEVAPERTDINTWVQLQDVDDERSFGIVDLQRRAPRSPYNTAIYNTVHLARLVDKGRAANGGTLGAYFYGEDSGIDRIALAFIGVSPDAFSEALKALPTDADVEAWLKKNYPKDIAEIVAYNQKMTQASAQTERHRNMMAKALNRLAPGHTDINTWFALMLLDDEKTFAI